MAPLRVCAVLSTVAGLLGAEYVSAADALPVEIRTSLNKNFPGWRFPLLGSRITNCNARSAVLIHGDFDGDGRPDYAVEIVYLDNLILFARLGNGRDQVLSRSPLPAGEPGIDQGLDVLRKGERISDGPVYLHDAVVRLDCSGPATVTYFTVRAGKWRSDLQITE